MRIYRERNEDLGKGKRKCKTRETVHGGRLTAGVHGRGKNTCAVHFKGLHMNRNKRTIFHSFQSHVYPPMKNI